MIDKDSWRSLFSKSDWQKSLTSGTQRAARLAHIVKEKLTAPLDYADAASIYLTLFNTLF